MSALASSRNIVKNSTSLRLRATVAEYSGTLSAKRSAVGLALVLDARRHEHRADRAGAERPQDVEAADACAAAAAT